MHIELLSPVSLFGNMATRKFLLSGILNEDRWSLATLYKNLKTNGWCFVGLDRKYKQLSEDAQEIKKYLAKDNLGEMENRRFTNKLGYSQTDYKDHYRVITKDYLKIFDTGDELSKKVRSLAWKMDKMMFDLAEILERHLFKLPTIQPDGTVVSYDGVGLLDFVQYRGNYRKKIFVESHVDPGWFALNILSDAKGMEFYSKRLEKWVALPEGVGVIFCGAAAQKFAGFPGALHRVVNTGVDRYSVWYEFGVNAQVPSINSIKRTKKVKKVPGKRRPITLHSEGKKFDLQVVEDATLQDVKEEIEKNIGIPHGKVLSPSERDKKDNKRYVSHYTDRKDWTLNLGNLFPGPPAAIN